MKCTRVLVLLPACFFLIVAYASAQKFGDAELVYEWNLLEFDWPSNTEREQAIANGSYVPERSLLAGIKLYKGQVYVTIPRWRWPTGHPVVLAKIIKKNNTNILQPYPSWLAQKQGDCRSLQYVQSMEIDPNTGRMYVIDSGRIAHSINVCPAKLVVYDLNTNMELDRYEFPDSSVNKSACFLNDLVLDYENGEARRVYITNTFESSIVVWDILTKSSFKISHSTMGPEGNNAENITINGVSYTFPMPINGIAMTPGFDYVYYCSLAGYNLHQIPTSTLRNMSAGTTGIRTVGRKASQTDGLAHGDKRLYYGAIGLSSVNYWDKPKDLADQQVSEDKVHMKTQLELKKDNRTFEWPDTFAFDEQGYLWVITSRLQVYWSRPNGLPATGDPFLRIWKIFVDEKSYLYQANTRTKKREKPEKPVDGGKNGSGSRFPFFIGTGSSLVIVSFISLLTLHISRRISLQ